MFNTLPEYNFYCQKVLPLVYDQSLSYYEVLCQLRKYLNDVIKSQNQVVEGFLKLLDWVNSQLEIYAKEQLQEWLDDGTLESIINDTLLKEINDKVDNAIISFDEYKLLINSKIEEMNQGITSNYNEINQLKLFGFINSFDFVSNNLYIFTKDFVKKDNLIFENLKNVEIDFRGRTIDLTTMTSGVFMTFRNCENITIKNAIFTNTNTVKTWVTPILMEECKFCNLDGLTLYGGLVQNPPEDSDKYNCFALVDLNKCQNTLIKDSKAQHCYAPYRIRNGSRECGIVNCHAERCNRFAMLSGHGDFEGSGGVNTFPGVNNCYVRNSSCNFLSQIFVKVEYDCKNNVIDNNYILNVGMDLGNEPSGGIISCYKDTIISNNILYSTDNLYKGVNGYGAIHLYNKGVGNNIIQGNTIKGLTTHGISAVDGNNNNVIKNNIINNVKNGIIISLFSGGTTGNNVSDNEILNCNENGIVATYSSNSIVQGNKLKSIKLVGIKCDSTKSSNIISNFIEDIQERGINFGGTAKSNVVIGNTLINCNLSSSDTNKRALAVSDNAQNFIITSNIIDSAGSLNGIYIGNVSALVVSDNISISSPIYINNNANKLSTSKNFANGIEV